MKKTIINVCILLLFSLTSLSSFAQDANRKKIVSGTVIDPTGMPLPGVNILEKGTRSGVVSDFDGNYTISVNPKGSLVFSFIGMKTAELSFDDKTIVNITLQEDAAALDEVVVVGYGTQKREAVTGSVATVKMSEIEDLPVGNLTSALVGRVLGVSISGGDSRPGEPGRMKMRNPLEGNYIRAKDAYSTEPLYVIDGVVQLDPNTGYSDSTLFNSLDASQVESISFLKDASAAIYGSRAAQGVVLVTTKKGKIGPAKFSYSADFAVSDETYRTKMLDAYQYAKVFNTLNGPGGANKTYDPADPAPNNQFFFSPQELDYFQTLDYDFLDDYWTSSSTQRHNLNLTGGTENATYFGGISYFTQDGNLGTLNYDKWSFRAGSSVNLAKGFKADFQVSGYFTDISKTASSGFSGNTGELDYSQLVNRTPFVPFYINGLPAVLNGSSAADRNIGYHYGEIQRLNNLAESVDNNIGVNINIEYEVPFIKGLKLKANYARQEAGGRGTQKGGRYNLYEFYGPDSDLTDNMPYPTPNPGQTYIYYESGSGALGTNLVKQTDVIINSDRILIDNNRSGNVQTRFQATYEKGFGKHNISALFAVEKSERNYNKERIIKFGVPDWSDGMLWQATGAFDSSNTYNWRGESGDLGYIGRLNYDYDGKYYGEFLFRSDASAKFAPQNYWGNFYAISGGWIISKEKFFKSNVFDYLKFRGSVGVVGKDDIKPWQWSQNFDFRTGEGVVFGGNLSATNGLKATSIANIDLIWGKELKTNFGFESKFLNNRLSVLAETFYNIGTDLPINLNEGVPFTVGGATAASNSGRADTWGKEMSIGWSDTVGKDFNYSVTINMGWYNNNVFDGNFSNEDYWYPWQRNKPGSSDIGTWGYDYQGMFKSQADIDRYIADTGVTKVFNVDAANLKPGMLYYRDVRGKWDPDTRTFEPKDGIINEFDRIQLKKPAKGPQGLSSAFRFGYKGFSLNTVLSVNWGGYREVGSAKSTFGTDGIGTNYQNRPAFWANMFDPLTNPNGTIPNLSNSINGNAGDSEGGINTVSSKFWQVSSFSLAMRNINLSYSLPKSLIEKVGISSFKLNLVAINPFILFNPYKDYDLSPYGSYDSYPTLKTYSLGLNIGF